MEPVIEPATIEDLPFLAELLVGLFTEERDFDADLAKQTRGIRLILENPSRGRIFVLRQHDQIVGMINLLFTISTAEGGFVMLLEDLVIEPSHRRLGYGDKLIQYALAYAKEKNFLRISLLAEDLNHESVRFFRNHNFRTSDMVTMRYKVPVD